MDTSGMQGQASAAGQYLLCHHHQHHDHLSIGCEDLFEEKDNKGFPRELDEVVVRS